jgi:glyoxylase-like metal-dependent hydrolase (beta-lactamase superfamily II)
MTKLLVETEYFTLNCLFEGVYAAIAKPGQGAWSNAGIVDLGGELLVFDSFSTPSAAQVLRQQAEVMTGKKVKYLINSHYHGDHVFGNQVFEDVAIISTPLTKKWFEDQNSIIDVAKEIEEMNQYLDNLKNQLESTIDPVLKFSLSNQYAEMSKVLEELPHLKMVFPSLIFEKHLVIQGSMRNVELHCLGGGHSPSDTFLYLPAEKIAFMGDIITENLHLPIYNPDEFLSILNEVKKIEIETVIPGHGDIGTLELSDTMVNYLSFLIKKVKEALDNKVSLNDFISEFITPSEYANWKGMNGINRNLTTLFNFYR